MNSSLLHLKEVFNEKRKEGNVLLLMYSTHFIYGSIASRVNHTLPLNVLLFPFSSKVFLYAQS